MPQLRWPAQLPPSDELGVVVHGPVVLARSPGITAGLRCVLGHPTGLHLLLVLRAEGVQAEAATRQAHRRPQPGSRARDPWAGPLLVAELDGERRTADPARAASSGGADRFDSEAAHWIGRLPADGLLRLTFGWPAAGLAEHTTELRLGDLAGLAERVISLR